MMDFLRRGSSTPAWQKARRTERAAEPSSVHPRSRGIALASWRESCETTWSGSSAPARERRESAERIGLRPWSIRAPRGTTCQNASGPEIIPGPSAPTRKRRCQTHPAGNAAQVHPRARAGTTTQMCQPTSDTTCEACVATALHACGGEMMGDQTNQKKVGSSAPAGERRGYLDATDGHVRFIRACGGETSHGDTQEGQHAVHPRLRGRDVEAGHGVRDLLRFIRACGGETDSGAMGRDGLRRFIRACGGETLRKRLAFVFFGPSKCLRQHLLSVFVRPWISVQSISRQDRKGPSARVRAVTRGSATDHPRELRGRHSVILHPGPRVSATTEAPGS
jgi:hypothetical protein